MDTRQEWWLTLTRANTICGECQERIGEKQTVAYNYSEGRVVCEVCIDRLSLTVKHSKRWREAQAKKQKRTPDLRQLTLS